MNAVAAPRYVMSYKFAYIFQGFSLIGEHLRKLLHGIYYHSGRTDERGGHNDIHNKSGLGSYHYHHGESAHLHTNGDALVYCSFY